LCFRIVNKHVDYMISSEEPIGPKFMSYIWAKCINRHMFTSNGSLLIFTCLVRRRDYELEVGLMAN